MNYSPVEQWNTRGERVMLFYSIAQAAEHTSYTYNQIYAAIRNQTKLGRHYFTYFGEKPNPQPKPAKIFCYNDEGEVLGFATLKEASEMMGIEYKRLSVLLHSPTAKDKNGYHWTRTPPKV